MTPVEILSYADPAFVTEDGRVIVCTVTARKGGQQHGPVPFAASPDDPESHGRALYARIVAAAGSVPIKPYVPPPEKPKAAPGAPRVLA